MRQRFTLFASTLSNFLTTSSTRLVKSFDVDNAQKWRRHASSDLPAAENSRSPGDEQLRWQCFAIAFLKCCISPTARESKIVVKKTKNKVKKKSDLLCNRYFVDQIANWNQKVALGAHLKHQKRGKKTERRARESFRKNMIRGPPRGRREGARRNSKPKWRSALGNVGRGDRQTCEGQRVG